MMKYILYVALILSLLAGSASANEVSQGLKNLYYNAMINPDTFDEQIQNDRILLRNTFSPCLNSIIAANRQQANIEVQRCRSIPGAGENYLQCIRQTPASSAVVSSQDMLNVLNGNILWRDTTYGRGMVQVKYLYQQMGLDYKGMIDGIFSMVGQLYQCPR